MTLNNAEWVSDGMPSNYYVCRDQKYGVWQAWSEHRVGGERRRRLCHAANTLRELLDTLDQTTAHWKNRTIKPRRTGELKP